MDRGRSLAVAIWRFVFLAALSFALVSLAVVSLVVASVARSDWRLGVAGVVVILIGVGLLVLAWRWYRSEGWRFWLAPLLVAVAYVVPGLPGAVFYFATSSDAHNRAYLAHDRDAIARMRSAIATYYGQHGSFPEHPGNYVNPTPPIFRCVYLTYYYGPTSGELRITSTNTTRDCP